MSFRHSLFAAMLSVVSCVADAAETYRNPIIDDNLADPAVIRHDGAYYLYATGGVDGDNGYRDGAGQWWFVYHQKRTARREWDRFICIDPLRFDEQGQLHGRGTRGEMLPGPALRKDRNIPALTNP